MTREAIGEAAARLPWDEELVAAFGDERAVKVLATVDADGTPHAVVKGSLRLRADGTLVHLELLESSHTNKNLLRALWFGGRVAVTVVRGLRSWQIIGRPVRAHVAGPSFQEEYVRVRERLGDVDLAAVWELQPETVVDQSPVRRRREEEEAHPGFLHLDRIRR